MEVTRIFHPVGQGGFYTESFDNQHMVVYDCGGSDNVKESIDHLLDRESSPQIEAVFISKLLLKGYFCLVFLRKLCSKRYYTILFKNLMATISIVLLCHLSNL